MFRARKKVAGDKKSLIKVELTALSLLCSLFHFDFHYLITKINIYMYIYLSPVRDSNDITNILYTFNMLCGIKYENVGPEPQTVNQH